MAEAEGAILAQSLKSSYLRLLRTTSLSGTVLRQWARLFAYLFRTFPELLYPVYLGAPLRYALAYGSVEWS